MIDLALPPVAVYRRKCAGCGHEWEVARGPFDITQGEGLMLALPLVCPKCNPPKEVRK